MSTHKVGLMVPSGGQQVALACLLVLGSACGPNSTGNDNGNGGDGGLPGDAGATDSGGLFDGGGPSDAGNPCEPPDMLIVLDRTMSMHRQPNGDPAPQASHELSKWYLAIEAIETVTAAYDLRLRFGLELFPRDPGGGACVTLTQRIAGTTATNPSCQEGEVLVLPAVGSGGDIANAVDPETTLLCTSTPIGGGLDTALTTLSGVQDPLRGQYVLLVTDGQDTCATPDSLERVQALAEAGVHSFIVGFDASGTGVDPVLLNNMACAGRTAPDFQQSCTDPGTGYVAVDPNGATLFLSASDGAELASQLEDVSSAVGCIVE
ncbi:MAG: vWA domain-containing protein [bacterium]